MRHAAVWVCWVKSASAPTAAIDENGDSDNPEYMVNEKAKTVASGDFENIVVVTLELNGARIMDMLRPNSCVLKADMVSFDGADTSCFCYLPKFAMVDPTK